MSMHTFVSFTTTVAYICHKLTIMLVFCPFHSDDALCVLLPEVKAQRGVWNPLSPPLHHENKAKYVQNQCSCHGLLPADARQQTTFLIDLRFFVQWFHDSMIPWFDGSSVTAALLSQASA